MRQVLSEMVRGHRREGLPRRRENYERQATDKSERGENTHQPQDPGVRQSIGKLKWHF